MIKHFLMIPEGMIRIKHANTLGNVYFIIPEGVIKSFLIIPEGMIRIKYANTLGNVYFIIPEGVFPFRESIYNSVPSYNHYATFEIVWII